MPLSPRWRWKLERWKQQYFGWLFAGGREEAARPRMCPSCGQLAGVNARRCPNCGASMTFSLAAASRAFSRYLPETSPATYGILFFCFLMYGLSLLATLRSGASVGGGLMDLGAISSRVLMMYGASLPWFYNLAQPWRLVTAVFLHASLIHIGFNMWVLMDIGPMVEEIYGSARYLFIFVVTGIFGYVVSSFFGNFSIGASGALLGLIGVLLAVTSRHRSSPAAQMLRRQLLLWLFFIFVLVFFMPGIDNYAHAGGFVAGFLLGRVMIDREPADPVERKWAYALGWLAGGVVALSFVLMASQLFHLG